MINRKALFQRKKLMLGIASAVAISVSNPLFADDGKVFDLNIEGKSASASLMALAKEASVEIMMPYGLGISSQKVVTIQGAYTLKSALDQMLEGTGLVYEFVAEDSIVIKESRDGEGEKSEKADEEVVVTGSRIRNVSPTGNVVVITREEFEKLGVNSAEDIIRSLPQNFSAINSGTTTTGQGNNTTPIGTIGQSSANLRGLGSSATLVLVNNRRIAGSPNYEGDGTINISTIPAAAIQRVEILLEGASAIYGSDALGGVVNFRVIVKSGVQPFETAAI